MNVIHYIGLDVHKKAISYCVKTVAGQIVLQGKLEASRSVLRSWAEGRHRAQFATQKLHPSGEPLPPSQREPPFPLDSYLSWTSPKRPPLLAINWVQKC
jgi:hypothetical protein